MRFEEIQCDGETPVCPAVVKCIIGLLIVREACREFNNCGELVPGEQLEDMPAIGWFAARAESSLTGMLPVIDELRELEKRGFPTADELLAMFAAPLCAEGGAPCGSYRDGL